MKTMSALGGLTTAIFCDAIRVHQTEQALLTGQQPNSIPDLILDLLDKMTNLRAATSRAILRPVMLLR